MLNIRKETEVAIHLLKFLSAQKDKSVSLKDVSEKIGVSFLFLQKVARRLRVSGLIQSEQGVKGGYRLTKDPSGLTLAQIVRIMGDECVLLKCLKNKDCINYKKCSTRLCLDKLNKQILKIMDKIKLADL